MKTNIEFLYFIYQTTRKKVAFIHSLNEKIIDEELKIIIKNQLDNYETLCDKAIRIFLSYGKTEKLNLKSTKISDIFKKLTTIDKSNNHFAKILIEASNKTIMQTTEKLNHYANTDHEIINLAKKLIKQEQNSIEQLKQFL